MTQAIIDANFVVEELLEQLSTVGRSVTVSEESNDAR